jgi:CRP/FNR family transcriptional regulator, dissimilatory nitrate respiration regulator
VNITKRGLLRVKKQIVSGYNLKNFYLFAGLSDQQRERLCQSALQFRLNSGEFLFEHGQNAERFFILTKGHLKLVRLSPEGTEKVIEIINPGESFAEAIMFMPRQIYPVSAQAIMASEVLGFDNNVFLGMLEDSFDTCKRVMCDMGMRLRMWLNEIDNLTLQNATYRLVHYLLSRIPPECRGDCLVEFTIPKHVIASRLSVKPETLSRIFNQLSNEGLLESEGRGIRIHSADKLRQYVYFDLD